MGIGSDVPHAKDYYVILGVDRSETPSRIKSAFRERVHAHHPDRAGAHSGDALREIIEAYRVLSDVEQRERYDREIERRRQRERELERQREIDRERFAAMTAEPLRAQEPRARAPEPLGRSSPAFALEVDLSPRTAARGARLSLALPVVVRCPACDGTGRDWFHRCLICRGAGELERTLRLPVHVPPGLSHGDELIVHAGLVGPLLIKVNMPRRGR